MKLSEMEIARACVDKYGADADGWRAHFSVRLLANGDNEFSLELTRAKPGPCDRCGHAGGSHKCRTDGTFVRELS